MRNSCLANVIRSCANHRPTPSCRTSSHHHRVRLFHHQTKPYSVAVIGGGITGITAAWRLCHDPKCREIVLYEKSPKLGGWLQSETVEVNGGHVVFEWGPRTIRSGGNSLLMLDMLFSLDMAEQVCVVDKGSPASLNRFLYYPDHIVRMPAPEPGDGGRFGFGSALRAVKAFFREPVFEGAVGAFFKEPTYPPSNSRKDESLANFISRRLSPKIADNLVSAVYHGIFAGDIYRLSAQTILGKALQIEREYESVLYGVMEYVRSRQSLTVADNDLAMWSLQGQRPKEHFDKLRMLASQASVFTLKGGVADIGRVASNYFEKRSEKIKIVTEADITAVKREENHDITISRNEHHKVSSQTFNRVIATAPASEIARLIEAGSISDSHKPLESISRLKDNNYAVTVMVVNLYYDEPNLIPYRGFGYLIPRSIPLEQNPERGLGVIFGTETSHGQDTAPGTKLTVMMGGHWWDQWKESQIPSPEEAIIMARSLLKRHLGIQAEPAVARAKLQRNAIPQPTVNHLTRMEGLSSAVRNDFDRRLTLAGNWYTMHGVGLTDCTTSAHLAATWGVNSTDGIVLPSFIANVMEDQEGGIPTSNQRYFKKGLDNK